ncbi:MAG: hypothetical protein V4733_02840 [Verrucomicrobiota bacterium]
MIRLLSCLSAAAAVFATSSCCCTSDVKPAALRPLPQFKEIQTTHEVEYTK